MFSPLHLLLFGSHFINSSKYIAIRRLIGSVFGFATLLIPMILGTTGCRSESAKTETEQYQRPLKTMEFFIARERWQEAWELSEAVLKQHADDAEVLHKLAHVAFKSGKTKRSAELLIESCRMQRFENEKRVEQALLATISAGELFSGIEMLRDAVEAFPERHEIRRLLYDFEVGTENRLAGQPHGRYLVRQRKFDLELLMSLSNSGRRSLDPEPLNEMLSRNPADLRPSIGQARIDLDQGELGKAIKQFDAILKSHPEFTPATALLCAALAKDGQFKRLENQFKQQANGGATQTDGSVLAFAEYWIAMGDWAEQNERFDWSVAAFAQATDLDPDKTEAWQKLHAVLRQVNFSDANDATKALLSEQSIQEIADRAKLLSQFDQARNRFDKSGRISREVAAEMIRLLRQLGKPWEAEAWSAIATTLPADPAIDLQVIRNEILSDLSSQTPWITPAAIPEIDAAAMQTQLPSGFVGATRTAATTKNSNRPSDDATEHLEIARTRFDLEDQAEQLGVQFHGRTGQQLDRPGIMLHQTLGCGGGAIDFDANGTQDLYFCAAGGTPPATDSQPNVLFRNKDGNFESVPAEFAAADTGFSQGVAAGDTNEDGFTDLLVMNYGPNQLYSNQGDGTFVAQPTELAGDKDGWSTSAAIADIDSDGINDVVVLNYCDGITPVTVACGDEQQEVVHSCTPVFFPAKPDQFYRGRGDGTFEDMHQKWQPETNNLGRGLGVVVGQFDQLPGLDIFVANDMTNNHFWTLSSDAADSVTSSRSLDNTNTRRLVEAGLPQGLAVDERSIAQGSMGIAVGDFDADQDIDFYVTNFSNEYNTLHVQRLAGLWQDQTSRMGLAAETLDLVAFGTEAVDLDLDGRDELVVTNGHVDMFSRDHQQTTYAQPFQLFTQSASRRFELYGLLRGQYAQNHHVGRALWTAELNGDNRPDLVVTHQTEPVALLINKSPTQSRFLGLRLTGTESSRDAIGAVVTIECSGKTQQKTMTSGSGYLCSNEATLRFGLGEVFEKSDLEITWPSGLRQKLRGVDPGLVYRVVEGQSIERVSN